MPSKGTSGCSSQCNSSWSKEDRAILFLGPKGSGKSRLINDVFGNPNGGPCEESHSIRQGTSDIGVISLPKARGNWLLIDTPGLDGSNSLSTTESVATTLDHLRQKHNVKVSAVAFVTTAHAKSHTQDLDILGLIVGQQKADMIIFCIKFMQTGDASESVETKQHDFQKHIKRHYPGAAKSMFLPLICKGVRPTENAPKILDFAQGRDSEGELEVVREMQKNDGKWKNTAVGKHLLKRASATDRFIGGYWSFSPAFNLSY
ncbi:hypothetical protein FA15DRAFT_704209 [Coprinopsis marcescibilis]|uniref:G domain-containing protein n=1 Tax=Coprinopsis marcescibilis TaxID=230819 RepID=A0A5C3KWX0_COPMA|nr:hypothetical protein FA15DRAFT_704209 [Coprinopsis marcescibilis]